MATLILTAVGTAIGGPIGGAIGATLGQAVDRTFLFAPKARHGPRLGDLSVQTSAYGSAIPLLFGTMRVAGTVIWSTDLIETRTRSGGGKGQPKTVDYAYAASFAVALSARPIRGVGRIWADGKLLRGAAGDFKSATGFRLHDGGEDQAPDPLIAAADGEGHASAFRGIAYAMFEDFALADYGNRIPSLTFEVEADAGPIGIGAIAAELSEGAVAAGTAPALTGYAAEGDSVRSAIEALTEIVPLSLTDDGATLRLGADHGEPAALPAADETARREIVRRGAFSLPEAIDLAYYDPARDFQTGLQRAAGRPGRGSERRALPAALPAADAKALAARRLAALWAGRTEAKVKTAWRHADLRPGGCVALAGLAGRWRIERWTLGDTALALDLVRLPADAPETVAASAGEGVSEPDLVHGPTIVRLYDWPLGDGQATKAVLFVAAAGAEAGWRRAALSASFDAGASWRELGATAPAATLGTALTALAAAGSALFDTRASVEVELAGEAMWLEGRSDDLLAGGANLAALGDELIQFGAAEPLGGRRFRLSRLLRGRRGSEAAAADHTIGEPFTLIEAERLIAIEAPPGAAGGVAEVSASGVGDLAGPAGATRAIEGAALRPPPPVHLDARETASGDLALSWVRRSRQGWAWTSGGDTPLGEEAEAYLLTIEGAGPGPGFVRSAELAAPAFLYTAAMRAADGGGPLAVSVVQRGTLAASRAATLLLP